MAKRIKKIESGSNMDGANMEGTKPNIKRVKLNSVNDSTTAPEYPPRPSLGRKRLDWSKKKAGKTPTGKGASGAMNEVISAMRKEDGGGDGGGGFGDGGGTVFTSTNAGIFTPTHGGNGKTKRVKSKKKRSGIERLGVFLTDGSPEKKMKKTSVLKEWIEKKQEQEEAHPPQFIEEAGEEDTSNRVIAEQQDMENKIKMLNDEEKKKEDDNLPTTDGVSAHMSDLQLSKEPMAFGNPQDDELRRGAKKDKSRSAEDLELYAQIDKDFDEITKAFLPEEEEVPIKKSVTPYDGPPSAKHLMSF